jgi:hypothetical protein
MIQFLAFWITVAFAYVYVKYVTNVLNVISDPDRNRFWKHLLLFLFGMILLHWIRLKMFDTEFLTYLQLVNVLYGIWNIHEYFHCQYSVKEVKRRKEDGIMSAISTSFRHSPLPYFIKRYDEERDLFLTEEFNKSFEDLILKPSGKSREDYLHSADLEEWSFKLATHYNNQDRDLHLGIKELIYFDSYVQLDGVSHKLSWTKYKDRSTGLLICFGNFYHTTTPLPL